VGHPDFSKPLDCPTCKPNARVKKLQKVSGMNAAEQEVRLADFVIDGRPGTSRMVEACREFCEEPSGFLTLWGGVGNGKTMALHATVNESIAGGRQAVYVTVFALLEYIKAAYNSRGEVRNDDAYHRLQRFAEVPVLALDELDKVRWTEWAQVQLTELIDKRYRGGPEGASATIIAMNDDPHGLPEWIASRLLDGRNLLVHNEDADIRPALRKTRAKKRSEGPALEAVMEGGSAD
jgi:DNA replication protein DnaC